LADFDAQLGRRVPPLPELSPTQRVADEAELYAGLRGVAGIVAGAQGVIDLLRDVAEFAAQAIPGADGVGVALIDPRHGISNVQTWAATAVLVHEIDTIQYDELNEGPCITCMQSRRPTVSGSLGSDSRWPHFGGRVARMRMHSALALPLIVDDQVIGSINATPWWTASKSQMVKAVRVAGWVAAPTTRLPRPKNNNGVCVSDFDAAMAGQAGHLAHVPCHTDRHGLQGGMQPARTQPYVRGR
jgi:hypothetical protein